MSLFPGPESDTVIQGRIWARPQRLNPVPSQVTSHESEPQAESLALESHGTPRGDSAWLDAELRLRASGFPAAAAGKLEKSPAAAGKSHYISSLIYSILLYSTYSMLYSTCV